MILKIYFLIGAILFFKSFSKAVKKGEIADLKDRFDNIEILTLIAFLLTVIAWPIVFIMFPKSED